MDDKYYKYVDEFRKEHGIHEAKKMAKNKRIEELLCEIDYDCLDIEDDYVGRSIKNILKVLKFMHRDD